MRYLLCGLAFLLPLLLLAPAPAPAKEEADDGLPFSEEERKVLDKALKLETQLVRLVKKIRPCSVSIENWRSPGRGRPPRLASGGSGVLISSKGYLLTNQHVINGHSEIWIVLEDHRRFQAKYIGMDKRGDVALLKIDAKKIKYADPRRADPSRLSPGEWVIATGNPRFLARDGEAVVTFGTISATGRVLGGQYMYGDALQHDAAINPGNSGGPLWDSNGNLLGINGRIQINQAGGGRTASSGVGYTISIDQIRNFFGPMMEGRKAEHGDELLGLDVETATDASGKPIGARVTKVDPTLPAATAKRGGVKVGDVVRRITVKGRAREVKSVTDFIRVLSPLAEGSKVTLHIIRGKKKMIFSNIELGKKGKRR
ncbi:MAG: trypsin-like peptidase domain-containing protein [Planctomycetota bacterium]